LGRGVDEGGGDPGVALLFVTAFVLIIAAAVALGTGLLFDDGLRFPIVALVASVGGVLLLWLGVVRRSGSPPPSAG
jgi:hypothetical protein